MPIDFARLREPFAASDVRWKPQAVSEKSNKALAVAYVTARAIQDRLDDVCGPENWQVSYAAGPAGGVICRLSIRCGDDWITKEDGADNTQVEAIKGGISDALRRAGYVWGIGRYLYDVPSKWLDADFVNGRFRQFSRPPALPAWALPHGTPEDRRTPPVDEETGELLDESPSLTPTGSPANQPAPVQTAAAPATSATPTQSQNDMWKAFTAVMTSERLGSPTVKEFLGGFSAKALADWMDQDGERDPVAIVLRIKEKQLAGVR